MAINFKSKKLWILTVSVLLLVFVVLKKTGVIGSKKGIEVSVEKAQKRTIIETVSASGKVQPEVEVKISADVSGQIVELFVKEGAEVKKGDVLCKINPDLYITSLERMEATVNSSKANLANTKARLVQVKASFANIEATYNRNKKLFEQNIISKAEMDASEAQFLGAKADVTGAEQNVAASDYNVNSTQASLKEANVNLTRTTIVAPVSGKISKLNVENGDRVVGTMQMAGTEIMRIANLSEMEVNVDVNENDIVRISMGDTADIEIDAYNKKKFKGIVTEIANSANTVGLSAEQVTNFPVKVRILRESYVDLVNKKDPNASPFRPGMSATVDILTETVFNTLSVSIQSVTTRDDTTSFGNFKKKGKSDTKVVEVEKVSTAALTILEYVFISKDGKAELREVKTGVQDNNFIQIISGIEPEEEIISGPYSAVSKILMNKSLITVVDKNELFDNKKDE